MVLSCGEHAFVATEPGTHINDDQVSARAAHLRLNVQTEETGAATAITHARPDGFKI